VQPHDGVNPFEQVDETMWKLAGDMLIIELCASDDLEEIEAVGWRFEVVGPLAAQDVPDAGEERYLKLAQLMTQECAKGAKVVCTAGVNCLIRLDGDVVIEWRFSAPEGGD
jgi:hypothetical protein